MGLIEDMYMLNKFYEEGIGRYPKTKKQIDEISDTRRALTDNGYIRWESMGPEANQYLPSPTIKGKLVAGLALLIR
ncbi:MAG: hypothetical protein V1888_04125 [archaeon]